MLNLATATGLLCLLSCCGLTGCQTPASGSGSTAASRSKPSWTLQKPRTPEFFVGVGMAEKRGNGDHATLARNQALSDLSQEITVTISSDFINRLSEASGATKEEVHAEIRATTRARLVSVELVAAWEDRKEYWRFERVSKAAYYAELLRSLRDSMAAAQSLMAAADAEPNPVSAIKFYFQAIDTIEDLVACPLPEAYSGPTPLALVQDIFARAQRRMSAIELQVPRKVAPALDGMPLHERIQVLVAIPGRPGREPVPNLPLIFHASAPIAGLNPAAQTDPSGLAYFNASGILTTDYGKSIEARVDVPALYGQAKDSTIVGAMLQRLTAPTASLMLKGAADAEDYLWRREFEGQRVAILCAYEAAGTVREWTKMHDELSTWVQGRGGVIVRPSDRIELPRVIEAAADIHQPWAIGNIPAVDLVLVVAAVGKLDRRRSAHGEEVQFGGELLCVTQRGGTPGFSDRLTAQGGWNPMGERMAMDVFALNAMKRWRSQYLLHLGNQAKDKGL